MKVRILPRGAGLLRNRVFNGQCVTEFAVVDLPESIALELIDRECAEPVSEPTRAAPVIETAEVAPPRNAARRTAKPKPRG